MTKNGIISVQLDRQLRAAVDMRRKQMQTELGREVRDAEIVRTLLRHALGGGGSLKDGAYTEGWRHGMAEAKEAFERGVDGAREARRSAG